MYLLLPQEEKDLDSNIALDKFSLLYPLASEVLESCSQIPNTIKLLPKRIIHGDLKLNNIRFDEAEEKAVCLLDLDTMIRLPVCVDIGDAARSWCNQKDEADENSEFNVGIFEKMLEGYLATASFITKEELASIPNGVKALTLELSARFIIDAFEETYFKLDPNAFEDLYDQNLHKARAQIRLFKSIKSQEPLINSIIELCGRNLS